MSKTIGDGTSLTGFLVVRLRKDGGKPAEGKTLDDQAKRAKLAGLSATLEKLGNPNSERLIKAMPIEKVLELERHAEQTDFPPLRSLTQYWRIDLRDRNHEETQRAMVLLRQTREVEMVREEVQPMPAAVTPGDDGYNAGQHYQDAAPTGIDARWMWTQPSGEGAGVGVVDIEGGWRVTHEDLVGKAPTLIHGAQSTNVDWVGHGTAVLGEIVATDNTVGVVGTAPAIISVRMSSVFDAAMTFHIADAFIAAIAAMSAGEIMLIELQTSFLPMETEDDLLDLIRLAVAQGILVVEAAGNGNTDLDSWTTPGGLHRMNRGSADFVDSGALMVGACVSTVPHERWWASNFGSRIDCFAWGENVTTCGYDGHLDDGGGNPDRVYTDRFQGTSSASPIIVSAAALVQSRHKAVAGTFLSPIQVRSILSNPATGTAQGGMVAGAIGVMPNLAAIVPNLGLVPDIYLRDAVGDTGAIPWGGAISVSPDVVVRPDAVADPQTSYGEGSGTEGSSTLGFVVESGQDNFIYVRVRNRGGSAAANVVATIYWSEVATLVTPGMWHLIGSVMIPNVPTGDVLTVSSALVWPAASIPATGHYCFVATLQHAADPSPPIPGPMDFADFYDLVRGQNNVTWRNFNVENNLPDPPSASVPFYFLLTGAEGRPEWFTIELERQLPQDARLILEGPPWLIQQLQRAGREVKVDRDKMLAQMTLPALPRVALGRLALGKGDRFRCRLVLLPGKTKIAWGHGAAVRQLYRGEEVGRIAWQFAPVACLCRGKERPKRK
jgi:hypothetical protein